MDIKIEMSDKTCILLVIGDLVFKDQGQFKELISNIFKKEMDNLIVDLKKSEFLDSAGIGMLLVLHTTAEQKNIPTTFLTVPEGQVADTLKFAKLDTVLNVEVVQ